MRMTIRHPTSQEGKTPRSARSREGEVLQRENKRILEEKK